MSEERKGWFARLKSGLARSSSKLSEGIGGIFARRRLDCSSPPIWAPASPRK
jgi:fused signal recognition particle receptor